MRFALIVLILGFLTGCEKNKVTPVVEKNPSNFKVIPDQESWNSKIVFTNAGKPRAILYAKHLQVFETKNLTLLFGIKIFFFNEKGKQTSVLTAKRGKVDEKTKDMFAYDSVVARNDSGFTLRTDFLKWNNKTRKISTDRFVTIDNNKEHIEGFGFDADEDLKNYVIRKVTYVESK